MKKNKKIPVFNHERFLSRIAIDQESGCWNWAGGLTPLGYGYMVSRNSNFRSHRMSYELFKGALSETLVVDHICRNRKCVNPDHLREVTQIVNALENTDSLGSKNKAKTHCKYGHELSGENVHWYKGYRVCIPCRKKEMRRQNDLIVLKNKEKRKIPNKLKTHCKRGHEFNQENTVIYKGKRKCASCSKEYRRVKELN